MFSRKFMFFIIHLSHNCCMYCMNNYKKCRIRFLILHFLFLHSKIFLIALAHGHKKPDERQPDEREHYEEQNTYAAHVSIV